MKKLIFNFLSAKIFADNGRPQIFCGFFGNFFKN